MILMSSGGLYDSPEFFICGITYAGNIISALSLEKTQNMVKKVALLA